MRFVVLVLLVVCLVPAVFADIIHPEVDKFSVDNSFANEKNLLHLKKNKYDQKYVCNNFAPSKLENTKSNVPQPGTIAILGFGLILLHLVKKYGTNFIKR